uniref:SFRICE_008513 n=1 Tax=Spodoptera frugiperda TaxID=7108 RepID=A0A2H1UZZ0_SPOFR
MEDISEKPKSARKSSDTIDSSKENSLESVVLAIDTGVKKFMAGKTKPSNIVDDVAKQLSKFAKNSGKPVYKRSGVQDYNIKPELIHLQSSDKPSVVLEINSKSIVNVLKDLLQSKSVHEYIDPYTKKAAVIYRAVREELDKSQANEMRNTE